MSPRPPIITFLPLPDARANRRTPSVETRIGQIVLGVLVLYVLMVLVMAF